MFAEKRDRWHTQPSVVVISNPSMSCGDLLSNSSSFLGEELEPGGPQGPGCSVVGGADMAECTSEEIAELYIAHQREGVPVFRFPADVQCFGR
jgi:hypothetical protein